MLEDRGFWLNHFRQEVGTVSQDEKERKRGTRLGLGFPLDSLTFHSASVDSKRGCDLPLPFYSSEMDPKTQEPFPDWIDLAESTPKMWVFVNWIFF